MDDARRARAEEARSLLEAGELAPAQRRVVSLIAEGLTHQQVAERLGVKRQAVHKHWCLARGKRAPRLWRTPLAAELLARETLAQRAALPSSDHAVRRVTEVGLVAAASELGLTQLELARRLRPSSRKVDAASLRERARSALALTDLTDKQRTLLARIAEVGNIRQASRETGVSATLAHQVFQRLSKGPCEPPPDQLGSP